MQEQSVAAMEDLGATIERLHFARSKRSIRDEQKLFVLDGIDDFENPRRNKADPSDIKHNFLLGFLLRAHVSEEYVWYVIRNGKHYDTLTNGPHWLVNWDIFFAKWQVRRVNLRTVLLPAFVVGRVKGPQLPHHADQSSNVDLALDVIADFRLLCKITKVKKFLRYESPIKTFYAYFNDMVREHISKLPYDQYGEWATTLRTQIQNSLQEKVFDDQETFDNQEIATPRRMIESSENFIGLKIEKVFVDSIASNREHDEKVLELYRLVEKAKRELEAALSMRKQGEILNILPSILMLQNTEAGQTLLKCDTELRKLMIAAGLRPPDLLSLRNDVSVEPVTGGLYTQTYLQSSQPIPLPPAIGVSGPLPSTLPGNTGGYGSANPPLTPDPPSQPLTPSLPNTSASQPLMPAMSDPAESRRAEEIEKLNAANFPCRSWNKKAAQFDDEHQPVPGGILWVLNVSVQRRNCNGIITFQCTSDYPQHPPAVFTRLNNAETKTLYPRWTPDRFLVDIVREIVEAE